MQWLLKIIEENDVTDVLKYDLSNDTTLNLDEHILKALKAKGIGIDVLSNELEKIYNKKPKINHYEKEIHFICCGGYSKDEYVITLTNENTIEEWKFSSDGQWAEISGVFDKLLCLLFAHDIKILK